MDVLLTRRPESLRFMGGAVVFPGGAVEAGDGDPRWSRASRLAPELAIARLGEDAEAVPALAYFVAALRESFEEVRFGGESLLGIDIPQQDARDPARWLEGCIEAGVILDTDALVPAGRWVTPLGAPIRFDTRFFVTRAPDGWAPQWDRSEVADCWWSTPSRALEELAEGRSIMAPPTIEMLQRLTAYASVEEALTSFHVRSNATDDLLSTRLSPFVHVVLAPNPGVLTGPGTNTYIVGGAGPRWVIDPAVPDDPYIEAVLNVAVDVAAILVTHRHPDHIEGAAALHARTGAPVVAFGTEAVAGVPVTPVADNETLRLPSVQLRVLHTPGHSSDHVCFYVEGAASLFSGDTILGEGTAVIAPPDGDMAAYMATLRRLRAMPIDRIYPGHFRAIDGGRAVIEGYLAHRAARETAIFDAVASGASELADIVALAYDGTPPELIPAASFSALAHLEMLERDGRVVRANDRWSVVKAPGPVEIS